MSILGNVTDSIEIPTTDLWFLTTTNSKKLYAGDWHNDWYWKW